LIRHFKTVFSERELRKSAYESGFCKIASKFSPLMFFDNLLYDAISDTSRSCNQIAIETQSRYGVDITKQGIVQRFNEGARKYIHSLIGEVLCRQVNQSLDIGWLKSFNK
jgi:hypothetical protein